MIPMTCYDYYWVVILFYTITGLDITTQIPPKILGANRLNRLSLGIHGETRGGISKGIIVTHFGWVFWLQNGLHAGMNTGGKYHRQGFENLLPTYNHHDHNHHLSLLSEVSPYSSYSSDGWLFWLDYGFQENVWSFTCFCESCSEIILNMFMMIDSL